MVLLLLLAFLAFVQAVAADPDEIQSSADHYLITNIVALAFLVLYFVVVAHVLTGTIVISKKYTTTHFPKLSPSGAEGVTILRPLKGIDTEMEACLSSAFNQDYPNFEILFCVESEQDLAVHVVRALIERHPTVNARLLIGDDHYGPNPKINNLAKGYKQSKHDLVWVLDSNAWVSPGTLARSVEEFNKNPRVKLVHHLPLAINTDTQTLERIPGSTLDEMFMLTAHAKFYAAINAMALAPCVMGKSNLYRRSDLDRVTQSQPGEGIRHFANYIAEDNMIAQALWNSGGRTAMTCDSVIQPQKDFTFKGYMHRRIRWLRVRRYMVLAATMIEPFTESLVAGAYGSFAMSVCVFGGSWSFTYFLFHMVAWCMIDYHQFHCLASCRNVEHQYGTAPYFVRPGFARRSLGAWFKAWAIREYLALFIWIKAMSGHIIIWRSRPFRIKKDLTAEEVGIGQRIPFMSRSPFPRS
ncbi:hypothetical protein TRVA0_011S01486 [Trichomonascus vanleenenianus]|uniref:ceramide glucosyltransferase n=1 Tax=Trichomonascus vanleenenianus TaxID=2268995 RepID=UPI003ECBA895